MSQNPNMLRTMVGIGLTLIFVLGYAVYSNTLSQNMVMKLLIFRDLRS